MHQLEFTTFVTIVVVISLLAKLVIWSSFTKSEKSRRRTGIVLPLNVFLQKMKMKIYIVTPVMN